jgi:hypothetical protein
MQTTGNSTADPSAFGSPLAHHFASAMLPGYLRCGALERHLGHFQVMVLQLMYVQRVIE